MKPCILFLTCSDQKEADQITKELLEKGFAVCVKSLPAKSSYRWKGKIEKASEILLIIDSVEENFTDIQLLLEKTHSYETFNLSMVKIDKTTDAIESWIEDEIMR